LKVAHVTPYFPPVTGGIETYVYELATRLAEKCDIEVFTCGRGVTEKAGKAVVHRIRAIDIKDLPLGLKIPYPIPPSLAYQLVKSKPDIIHVHGHAFFTSFEGALAARLLKRPCIMTIHDVGLAYMDYSFIRGLRSFFDSIPVQSAIRWSTIVIAQNSATRDYVSKFNPKKIVTIPQGVNTNQFKPSNNEGQYITFIAARLVKLKGDEVFIRAVPLIAKEIKDARFRVVGGGARENYLKELASENGVKDLVEFTGTVPHADVPRYLAEASIVVCPGPTGLLLLEAAAMKKIIITIGHEWALDALGNAAYFVPPNSPSKVSETVVYALENREASNALVDAAYKKVRLERSWEIVAQRHLDLYNAICHTQTHSNRKLEHGRLRT